MDHSIDDRARRRLLAAGLLSSLPLRSRAEPLFQGGRTVRFVVPFPPGGAADSAARYFGERIGALYGTTVVVDNRGGGNGVIGVQSFLSAPADGHTVFIGTQSVYTANFALFKSLPYDSVRDFAPVGTILRGNWVLVVPAASRTQTVAAVVEAARAAPGRLNAANATASFKLATERFCAIARIRLNSVPYKGSTDAIGAVATGVVDVSIIDLAIALPLIRAGKVTALAVAADAREPDVPTVPTFAEAGYPSFGNVFSWAGGAVAARTPPAIVEQWGTVFRRIGEMPATGDYFRQIGLRPLTEGPQAMKARVVEEVALWKQVATTAGIEPE